MADVSADVQKSSLFRELWERRVPHIVGSYILGSWAVIQFVEWVVARYLLSHNLTELSLRFLVFMLPAVVIFAWFHGRPGPDEWTRFEKRAYVVNFTAAAALLFFMFSGKNLGAATTLVKVEDEDGNQIQRTVLKAENFKDATALLFKNNSGLEELDHLQFGLPLAISYDLMQDRRVDVFQPWQLYGEMGTAEDTYNLPMRKQREIAADTRADFFLNGEFVRDGKDFVITTRLHDTQTGKVMQERTFTGPNYMELVDEISVQLRKDMEVPDYQLEGVKDLPIVEFLTASDAAFRSFIETYIAGEINKDYQRAIFKAEQCLREDSDWGLAYFRMLQLDSYVGRTDRMQDHMAQTMERIEAFPELMQYQVKSSYYLLRNESEKRFKVLQMWSELYPEDVDAKSTLAMVYKMTEQYDKAIEMTKAAIEIRDNRGDQLLSLADLYRTTGQTDEAIEAYESFNEKFPDATIGLMKLGKLYRDKGDYDKALENFERVALEDPNDIDAIMMIASIDDRLGNFEKAEGTYKDLLSRKLSPEERKDLLYRAFTHYTRRGMINKGVQMLEQRQIELTGNTEPINLGFLSIDLIVAYLSAGRQEEAKQLMEQSSSFYKGIFADAGAFIEMAYYMEVEDMPQIELNMKRITNYVNQFGNMRSYQRRCAARIAEYKEDFPEAIKLIEEQLADAAGSANVRKQDLARVKRLNGDHKGALAIVDELLADQPASAITLLQKARIYHAMGASAKARESLDKALEIWANADENYDELQEALALKAEITG